ncbi:MAG: hypothetical protein J1D77_07390 [Muribaculaceae bacterium]|nr:hypothetical protein [Muribaculaceae bacterium]
MKGRIPPLLSLWLLLMAALAIFVGVSFIKDDINIGGYNLTKARFPETLLAKEEGMAQRPDTLLADTLKAQEPIVVEPDTTVHNILIFGDSMTHNLAMSISKYGTKNHYKVTGVTWESSSIPGWSNSGKIQTYIDQTNPDFVIISLGSNEMELRHFDRRIPDVKKIIDQVGDIPFIWVGPPLWKEDKGVYEMLQSILPAGTLFRIGTDVEIQRGPDHVHPTRRGADAWTDTLMRWIRTSPHPILTELPDSGTSTKGHKFIYLHPND